MNRKELDTFIEMKCEQAAYIGNNDGQDGYPQALMIKCAVDKYIETNFKQGDKNEIIR